MIELVKLLMTKPLQAVVTLLCAVTISLHVAMTQMQIAMAVVKEQQGVSLVTTEQQKVMRDTLVRVDVSLSIIKENQDILLNRSESK